jgi:hypothetical protein
MESLCTHMRDCHANYLCLICSSYFPDLSELRQHESSHTEEEKEFGINVDIRQLNKTCVTSLVRSRV